jgi:Mn-containing catalase
MYYFDKRLQYPVKVEKPDPIFARQLQQNSAISRCWPLPLH